MNDNEIGIEAATLVALEYADESSEHATGALKLALATAAQIILDKRTEMLIAADEGQKRGIELDRLHAAIQNIVDANGNFMAALHTEKLIEMRLAK